MPSKNPKFDLKLKYQRVFEIGIIISISLIILAFRFFPEIKAEAPPPPDVPDLISIVDIPIIDNAPAPPPPPKPVLLITESLDDDNLPDIPIEETDFNSFEASEDAKFIEENEEIEELPPFRFVEDMPKIIGGFAALQKNVYYPEIAVRAGIEGKVIVQAIIDKTGNVEDVKIVKGLNGGCSEAAIKAVMKTKFKPGYQRGKPVRVSISIPIIFKLN